MDNVGRLAMAMNETRTAIRNTQNAAEYLDDIIAKASNNLSDELRPLSELLYQLSDAARQAEGRIALIHRRVRKESIVGDLEVEPINQTEGTHNS